MKRWLDFDVQFYFGCSIQSFWMRFQFFVISVIWIFHLQTQKNNLSKRLHKKCFARHFAKKNQLKIQPKAIKKSSEITFLLKNDKNPSNSLLFRATFSVAMFNNFFLSRNIFGNTCVQRETTELFYSLWNNQWIKKR